MRRVAGWAIIVGVVGFAIGHDVYTEGWLGALANWAITLDVVVVLLTAVRWTKR